MLFCSYEMVLLMMIFTAHHPNFSSHIFDYECCKQLRRCLVLQSICGNEEKSQVLFELQRSAGVAAMVTDHQGQYLSAVIGLYYVTNLPMPIAAKKNQMEAFLLRQ